MRIEFSGICSEGPQVAIAIYSRSKRKNGLGDYVCEEGEVVDCSSIDNKSFFKTRKDNDYLVVVLGLDDPDSGKSDAEFDISIECEEPTEVACDGEIVANTNSFEKIPTFYDDLAACPDINPDLPWLGASEVYNVVGKKGMSISFETTCGVNRNKVTLLMYSRRVGDDLGPVEGYKCEEVEFTRCLRKNKKGSIEVKGEEGVEYLFIVASEGVGDTVSLTVDCTVPTPPPTAKPTTKPTKRPTRPSSKNKQQTIGIETETETKSPTASPGNNPYQSVAATTKPTDSTDPASAIKKLVAKRVKTGATGFLDTRKKRFEQKAATQEEIKEVVEQHGHRSLAGRFAGIDELRMR